MSASEAPAIEIEEVTEVVVNPANVIAISGSVVDFSRSSVVSSSKISRKSLTKLEMSSGKKNRLSATAAVNADGAGILSKETI